MYAPLSVHVYVSMHRHSCICISVNIMICVHVCVQTYTHIHLKHTCRSHTSYTYTHTYVYIEVVHRYINVYVMRDPQMGTTTIALRRRPYSGLAQQDAGQGRWNHRAPRRRRRRARPSGRRERSGSAGSRRQGTRGQGMGSDTPRAPRSGAPKTRSKAVGILVSSQKIRTLVLAEAEAAGL